METIKVTSGMEDIKKQLDEIYSSIIPLTTSINSNLDKIKDNWKGTRSDTVLKNLEEIKSNNNKIPDNLKRNIDFIDEAYKKYMELEAARITQAQSTPTPTAVPITPSPTSTPGVTPTAVPITSSPTSTPGVTPTAVPITPFPTSTPGVTPTAVPITPSPTSTPGATPTVIPIIPTPTISSEENKDSAYYWDVNNYDRKASTFIGNLNLSDAQKQELDNKYRIAIEEGQEIAGLKGGLLASVKFLMKNGINIPFGNGKSDIYNPGLDTNLQMDKNAPDSVEWLQMLYHDVTGEEKVNFRLQNNSSLSNIGSFVSRPNIPTEIGNVTPGDIFFNKPTGDGVGHLYYVVGNEGDNFLLAELKRGNSPEFIGLNVISVSKEDATKFDGLTML